MSLSSLEKKPSIVEVENIDDSAEEQQKLEHKYTRWEAIKLYPRAAFLIFVICWNSITCSYCNQASGNVISIPTFRKDFGHAYESQYVLDGKWQSAISGGPLAGMVLGCFLAGSLADTFGRRLLMWIAMVVSLGFIAIEFTSTTIQVFFAGKLLNTICVGMLQTMHMTYIAETSPLALRAFASLSINFCLSLGPFICALVTYGFSDRDDRWSYRSILSLQWFFAGVASILIFFIPESPYYHVIKNNEEKAFKCVKQIYRDDEMSAIQLAMIKKTIEEANELADSGSFKELFDRKNWRRTLTAVSPYLVQPMSGLPFVVGYQTYYYQILGFSTLKSFQFSCGAQTLSLAGALLAIVIVDRLGRRFMVLSGTMSLTVVNLLVAVLGMRSDRKSLTVSAAFMTMYNFFFNCGLGAVVYPVTSEIPTIKLRAKTIGFGLMCFSSLICMWISVLPFMFNPDQANMGSKINFIFTGCTFASIFLFYYCLPETAGRSFAEIDELYKRDVPARKWKGYNLENFDLSKED